MYWQSKPDGGQYAAINEGFRHSTGDIMGWLNSDDKFHPNALDKLAYLFETNLDLEWLVGMPTIWSKDGALAYIETNPSYYSYKKFLGYNYDNPHNLPQDSTFWRRSLWNKIGGKLCLDYKLAADLWLWTKFLSHTPIHSVNTMIGGYRQTGSNAAVIQKDKYASESIAIIDKELQELGSAVYSSKPMPPVIEFSAEAFQKYCATRGLVLSSPCDAKCHYSYLSSLTGLTHGHFKDGRYTMELFLRDEFAKLAPSSNPEYSAYRKLITEKAAIAEDVVTARKYADKLFQSGDAHRAADIYKTILEAASLDEYATFGLALCCEANGDAGSFLTYLLKTIEINPYHENANVKAVEFYKKQGLFSEAKIILDNYITINPDDTRINQLLTEITAFRPMTNIPANESTNDESLQEAFEYIRSGAVSLLLVDFFDTLVSRLTPEPINLFIEVGRRLAARGLLKSSISPDAFRKLRQQAERQARKTALMSRHTDESTIAEIYRQLENIVKIPAEGVEVEIAVESEFCYLNPGIVELIRTFAGKYGKVVIISDTYFSSVHLASILAVNGFDLALVDRIYTSSDNACSKSNSGLFHVIMQQYGTPSHQILHVGDNEKADVTVPKDLGINTLYYYRMDALTEATVQKERILNRHRSYSASLDSIRVQASRLCSPLSAEDQGYFKIGSFLFGPLLARYADWVVGECRKEGVTTVLALMREAEVLGPMVERAAEAAGYPLKVTTFYASRSSMKLASLCKATYQSLTTRIDKHGGKITFDEVMKTFGLSSEILGLSCEVQNSAVSDLDALVHELTKGTIAQMIEKNSAESRVPALRYLQDNLASAEKAIVVDLGYRGMIQRYMEDIIVFEGVPCQLIGCYFTTSQGAARQILGGSDIRAYMGDVGTEEFILDCFRGHPEILEQSISAPIGSTEGYTFSPISGEVAPLIGSNFSSDEEKRKKKLIQEGIFSFQRRWLDIVLKKGFLNNDGANVLLAEIDDYSRSILHRLSAFPSKDEASLLGMLLHDDNNGFDTGNQICDDGARQAFRENSYHGLIQVKPYWHDGVVALERPDLIDNFFQTWLFHACM
jgi:predicted HAD superfamily hydrolase/glycosyltransferase involved in cell wall biosynthesis